METAEKLARFVAQVGPEIEQFSIENSADNPDLWCVLAMLAALWERALEERRGTGVSRAVQKVLPLGNWEFGWASPGLVVAA